MGNETSQSVSYGDKIDNNIVVKWKKVPCSFPSREGQICCSLGTKVYAFGGVSQHGEELTESNDLLVFDTEKQQQWTKLVVKGCPPPPRSAAAIAAVGKKLYLFGGLSQAFGWFDDLYSFDTETNVWSALSADGPKPLPRDKLQCVVINKKIHFFGGFGPKTPDAEELESEDDEEDELPDGGAEFGWFNDLYILDTEKNQWSQPMQMNLGVPTERAAHAMCAVDKDIIIFGGRDITARQNDLHIFNTDSRKWATELETKGRQPEPRSFHTAVSVGKRAIIMGGRGTANQHFADVHIFDTETKQWLQPKCEGDLPEPRGQHSLAVVGDKVVLFGGAGKYSDETMQCQQHFTDTYIINSDDFIKGAAKTAETNGHSS